MRKKSFFMVSVIMTSALFVVGCKPKQPIGTVSLSNITSNPALEVEYEELSTPHNRMFYVYGEKTKVEVTITNTGDIEFVDGEILDLLTDPKDLVGSLPPLKPGESTKVLLEYTLCDEYKKNLYNKVGVIGRDTNNQYTVAESEDIVLKYAYNKPFVPKTEFMFSDVFSGYFDSALEILNNNLDHVSRKDRDDLIQTSIKDIKEMNEDSYKFLLHEVGESPVALKIRIADELKAFYADNRSNLVASWYPGDRNYEKRDKIMFEFYLRQAEKFDCIACGGSFNFGEYDNPYFESDKDFRSMLETSKSLSTEDVSKLRKQSEEFYTDTLNNQLADADTAMGNIILNDHLAFDAYIKIYEEILNDIGDEQEYIDRMITKEYLARTKEMYDSKGKK